MITQYNQIDSTEFSSNQSEMVNGNLVDFRWATPDSKTSPTSSTSMKGDFILFHTYKIYFSDRPDQTQNHLIFAFNPLLLGSQNHFDLVDPRQKIDLLSDFLWLLVASSSGNPGATKIYARKLKNGPSQFEPPRQIVRKGNS